MKYYYDDPLISAYMSMTFRVRFETPTPDYYKLIWSIESNTFSSERSSEYYIHPKSLDVFKPQEGDRNVGGYVFENGQWVVDGMIPAAMFAGIPRDIDKRQGKHFFMPKQESDNAE